VPSKETHARKEKMFEKSLEKLDVQTTKSFKELRGLEFACEKDTKAAADHWAKNAPRYQCTHLSIVPTSRKIESKRGRPRKG
jgi:transposase